MNQNFTLLLVLCCIPISGCAHTQLRWNTTHQAKTLTEIYEQLFWFSVKWISV
jgi:hypothetical protein